MKKCKACGADKPLGEFHSNRTRKDGLAPDCKSCANAARRARKKLRPTDPAKSRAYAMKFNYGITPDDYECMFNEQNGLCAICKEAPPDAIDHDHSTGKVRGLLCRHCNWGLGHFKDNQSFLESAISYLD